MKLLKMIGIVIGVTIALVLVLGQIPDVSRKIDSALGVFFFWLAVAVPVLWMFAWWFRSVIRGR